ncbi:GNAT family N-acetyltransferase [Legionella tucsonensis]|uniref:N-acetyltransferase domain-containing protein n=1 Tax=Legionella tucsonensis TaxID=40335 RepID=A0A0W0ZUT7_9GAMM|nr:GNAT family N-acetyltransferase [Legionella tucsonensis]KTD72840.1 hypothetical protein Ltuc_0687 [Legionella tucsonensis]
MDLDIQHDKKNQRFYVEIDNKESNLKYKKIDKQTLDFFTTFVPKEQRGQGIAAKITNFALQYAKKNDYKIIPSCPFVKSYIDDNSEYKDLVVGK